MASPCTRSCFKSELGERDPMQEALAEIARLTADLDGAVTTMRAWHVAALAMRDLAISGDSSRSVWNA